MKKQCSGRVYDSRVLSSFSCASPATRQYKGKLWCFHHGPREKEKKRKAQEEKWKQEEKRNDEKRDKAFKLLKRLGVPGEIDYLWKGGYRSAIVISFDEVEKLLQRLGR